MVDIVDVALGVDQLDQIFDDGDDILAGENLHVHRSVEAEFFVDAVAAHLSEVVTFLAEEEALDHLSCRSGIRWIGVAQLPVDICHRLAFGIGGVFLQSVEDDAVVD